MNAVYRKLGALALVLGLAAAISSPAVARNTTLVLPIRAGLENELAQQSLDKDIAVSFGSALPNGLSIVNERMAGSGKADPRVNPPTSRGVVRPMSDEEACTRAFVAALSELTRQARQAGATSLVGVVSTYEGTDLDSKDKFECHAGYSRAVVELKGMAAVRSEKGGPTLARTQAKPATPVAATSAAAPPAAAAPVNPHRSTVPAATGFANAEDVSAVPLSEAGKARYRYYLTLPAPKAFVVYQSGAWRFYHGDPDAMTKALDYCAGEGKTCWLYAVDQRVVWSDNPARRIARSAQLGNE